MPLICLVSSKKWTVWGRPLTAFKVNNIPFSFNSRNKAANYEKLGRFWTSFSPFFSGPPGHLRPDGTLTSKTADTRLIFITMTHFFCADGLPFSLPVLPSDVTVETTAFLSFDLLGLQ